MSSTTDERINTLYGGGENKSVERQGNEPVNTQEKEQGRIDSLYPSEKPNDLGNPYAIKTDEADNRTDSLYGGTERVELSEDTDLSVVADTFQNADAEENLRSNLGFIASSVGLDQSQMKSLVATANEALITGDIPDSKVTMKGLYDEHGASLNEKLSAARALVASVPEVSQWLDSTGLGNHPGIIRQIINAAGHPRARARIIAAAKLHSKGAK